MTTTIDLKPFYEKYGQEKVGGAVKYLTYKGEIPELPKNESPGKLILYVFRHGQSEDNKNMLFSGWRDAALTEKGRQDAEIVGELLEDKEIGLLYSSDQQRTLDTMKIAMAKNPSAKNLEIHIDKRLRERSYGDWQGQSKLERHLQDPDGLLEVRRGWDKAPPNGESLEMVDKRVDELLDEIVAEMKKRQVNAAVACSSNSIRPIRKRFENLTEAETSNVETPTGKDYAAYVVN